VIDRVSTTVYDLLNPALASVSVQRGTLNAEALTGASALALPVAPPAVGEDEVQPRWGTADAASLYGIDLAELASRSGATGEGGNIGVVHLPRPVGAITFPWKDLPLCIYLVGVGDGTSQDLRRAGAALARQLTTHSRHTDGDNRVLTTVGAQASHDVVRSLLEGFHLGGYEQLRWTGEGIAAKKVSEDLEDSSTYPSEDPFSEVNGANEGAATGEKENELVLVGDHSEDVIISAGTAALATIRTRTLASAPSNIKNPQWFVDQAVTLADQVGLSYEVWDLERLTDEGFGGLLAVGAGSATEPRMIALNYEPEDSTSHVVLVGKGITYDTGGLSIKPRESMISMKTDMAGGAAVLSAVAAAAELEVPHKVTAVIPLAENAFGASSYRPGDVVTVYDGTTVEIANTDAEGRMVLADALGWADEHLDADIIVDIATLTGAATLGLGRGHAAAYGHDADTIDQLRTAGELTGEHIWHMPLVPEYAPALTSEVADLRHVPLKEHRYGAGSITAAMFLEKFVTKHSWVHLDIAGTGRATSTQYEISEGATGYGARLLTRWLESRS